MIQRLADLQSRAPWALALVLTACGARPPSELPRTLHGSTVRGAFVPPGSYEAYVRGELALAAGRAQEAVAQLELATTAPDEDPYLLSRLALAQLRAGDAREAARTLKHAERLDGCSEPVWLVRGELAASTGDVTAARAAFARAHRCAPASQESALALSALLAARGDRAGSLDVLLEALGEFEDARPQRAWDRSLREADAATFAYALASLGADRALESAALERAIALALERGFPRLALRLCERHAPRLPAALEADLLQANGLRDELAAVLAQHDAASLGGPQRTAELALQAGAYERAELESTTALQTLKPTAPQPSPAAEGSGRREATGPASEPTRATRADALHALHARASIALGRTQAAIADVRAIQTPSLRRALLAEALAALGQPALAREIGAVR